MDASLARLRERIIAANAARTPLRLRGSGSKDFYGEASIGEVLDTREHRGIVAYEPSELVITARCGTPLAEIEDALAQHGQCLPFEPPAFGGGATIGGSRVAETDRQIRAREATAHRRRATVAAKATARRL